MIFDAKNVRISQNHENSTPLPAIYLVLVVKIVFRIVIFRKIIDGDPTKIMKMLRKIDQHEAIAEKTLTSSFRTTLITNTRQFAAEAEI